MARDLSPFAGVAFPLTEKSRRPVLSFRSSITQPTDASVYASPAASRRPVQDPRSGWSRFSFPVGLFHPLQHAGLSRRTLRPSLHSLRRDGCLFVQPLHWYYGAVRPLPGVRVRLVVIRLPGPVCFRRNQGGLPVLVHIVSRRALSLRLRRARPWLANYRHLPVWPSR